MNTTVTSRGFPDKGPSDLSIYPTSNKKQQTQKADSNKNIASAPTSFDKPVSQIECQVDFQQYNEQIAAAQNTINQAITPDQHPLTQINNTVLKNFGKTMSVSCYGRASGNLSLFAYSISYSGRFS